MIRTFSAVLSVALVTVAFSPAFAQQNPSHQQPAAADPNERVCEDIILTGSRIGAKRFCGTRAEWADRKKQDREAIEKAQMGPCMLTHNGGNGKPGC
jgi:hypothetical protein